MIVLGEPTGPPATDAAVIEGSWAEPERFEAIFRRYFGQIHRYKALADRGILLIRPAGVS